MRGLDLSDVTKCGFHDEPGEENPRRAQGWFIVLLPWAIGLVWLVVR